MPLRDQSILVEESGSHAKPRFDGTANTRAPHIAADQTISAETAVNLDQGDPLAEADFHMAYGLYDQAADLVRIAIQRDPTRRDLKLKLLEVFFVWGNKEQFLHSAHELASTRAEAAPGEWEKILIMGKQLAPEDPLFAGGRRRQWRGRRPAWTSIWKAVRAAASTLTSSAHPRRCTRPPMTSTWISALPSASAIRRRSPPPRMATDKNLALHIAGTWRSPIPATGSTQEMTAGRLARGALRRPQ